MSKPWQLYARHIIVHNYLGDIDPLTVAGVINQHLKPLEDCIFEMLSRDEEQE